MVVRIVLLGILVLSTVGTGVVANQYVDFQDSLDRGVVVLKKPLQTPRVLTGEKLASEDWVGEEINERLEPFRSRKGHPTSFYKSLFVNKGGDNMSGDLVMEGNSIDDLLRVNFTDSDGSGGGFWTIREDAGNGNLVFNKPDDTDLMELETGGEVTFRGNIRTRSNKIIWGDGSEIFEDTDSNLLFKPVGRVSITEGNLNVSKNVSATHFAARQDAELGDPAGTIGFNDTRKTIAWSDGDGVEYPSFTDDVKMETTTVGGTGEKTVFSAAVDEDSFHPGRVYHFRALGNFTTASSSDFFILRVYIGDVEVAEINSTAENADSAALSSETIITVRSSGVNGEILPHTIATFANDNKNQHHGKERIDTTGKTLFNVTAQWDAQADANQLQIVQGILTREG